MRSVAVLMASHNRRELTCRSLRALEVQSPEDVDLRVTLVDCGSVDGTGAAARSFGEWVNVVEGHRDWFWAQAMAHGEKVALQSEPDFILWMNDDVNLDVDALSRLFQVLDEVDEHDRKVIVGSMRGSDGRISYGGINFEKLVTRWTHVEPSKEPREAQAANGNLLLYSTKISASVGPLDGKFGHSYADFDWTHRAHKSGFQITVAPGYYGTCDRNSKTDTHEDENLDPAIRWRKILGPKGLPPRAHARYLKRHGGVLWPLIWAFPYVRLIFRRFGKRA